MMPVQPPHQTLTVDPIQSIRTLAHTPTASANSLSEAHLQLTAIDRPGAGRLPPSAASPSVEEAPDAMDVSTTSALSSSRPTRSRAAAAAETAVPAVATSTSASHKRKWSAAEDEKVSGDGDGDATVASTAGTTRSSARPSRSAGAAATSGAGAASNVVVEVEDETASVATAGSVGASATSKKGGGGKGGGKGEQYNANFSRDAPRRLELLGDRNSRGTALATVIKIRPPDVRMKAFDWAGKCVSCV